LEEVLLADAALRKKRKITGLAPDTADPLQMGSATLYRKLKSYGLIGQAR
jgi:DNA-binding NtrC family response regulator